MASINEIVLNGFKAFPSKFQLTLEGKNLLLYGENGSGKSSIYYALHCIFNSFRKEDNGKKYFDKDNPQNLINKVFSPKKEGDIPYILVNWKIGARSPFVSTITKDGCDPSFARLAELDTCFINHQFLFSFFNFTNSKDANLFPIFQREILPYIFDNEYNIYISMMYEQILSAASKLGNKSSSKALRTSINIFNDRIEKMVSDINISASDIYDKYFKQEEDFPLTITLEYPQENPDPNKYFDGIRLKWDYPLIVNPNGHLVRAHNKRIIKPIITIKIEEDGKLIDKPHVYFNEAKLTAIALSVRFALLDLENPPQGSFLALDDMLISLDMSNRVKVVDFLLAISNKYKIYLFTHDRVFFEYFKERIFYANKSNGLKEEDGWSFKELYQSESPTNNPEIFDSQSDIAKAYKHYKEFDYPASANYLRKAVETMVNAVFPPKLTKQNCGATHEKLRNILDGAFSFFSKISEFDLTDLSRLISNLNLLMNPLSHKSTETNVYKIELNEIFAIMERLSSQIQDLGIIEILPRTEKVYLYLAENDHIIQKYEIELQEELYSYIVAGVKKVWQPKAKSIRSLTITDGIEGEYISNNYYIYANNYLELYKDKHGHQLSSLI